MELYCGTFAGQWSLGTYYFRKSNLLDESCQICKTRPSWAVLDISRAQCVILL
jgi:hypothetical protein